MHIHLNCLNGEATTDADLSELFDGDGQAVRDITVLDVLKAAGKKKGWPWPYLNLFDDSDGAPSPPKLEGGHDDQGAKTADGEAPTTPADTGSGELGDTGARDIMPRGTVIVEEGKTSAEAGACLGGLYLLVGLENKRRLELELDEPWSVLEITKSEEASIVFAWEVCNRGNAAVKTTGRSYGAAGELLQTLLDMDRGNVDTLQHAMIGNFEAGVLRKMRCSFPSATFLTMWNGSSRSFPEKTQVTLFEFCVARGLTKYTRAIIDRPDVREILPVYQVCGHSPFYPHSGAGNEMRQPYIIQFVSGGECSTVRRMFEVYGDSNILIPHVLMNNTFMQYLVRHAATALVRRKVAQFEDWMDAVHRTLRAAAGMDIKYEVVDAGSTAAVGAVLATKILHAQDEDVAEELEFWNSVRRAAVLVSPDVKSIYSPNLAVRTASLQQDLQHALMFFAVQHAVAVLGDDADGGKLWEGATLKLVDGLSTADVPKDWTPTIEVKVVLP